MSRLLPVFAVAALLNAPMALAQAESATPTPTPTVPAPPISPASPASGSPPASSSGKPTTAQQAVLDRIRRLRDGDLRRFGTCSYRWDRWKLQPDGSRTTGYSCEGSQIVNHTIGVNCSKLQINSYNPNAERSGSSERGSWGTWRLPEAGGEEQMVATLCANALPIPASASSPSASGAAAPAAGAAARTAPPAATAPAAGR